MSFGKNTEKKVDDVDCDSVAEEWVICFVSHFDLAALEIATKHKSWTEWSPKYCKTVILKHRNI